MTPPWTRAALAGGPIAVALLAGCGGAGPDSARTAAPAAPPWFVEATAESGLDFLHESGATGAWEMPEIMAGGAAIFDSDGDGDLDLYLTNGAFLPGAQAPAGGLPVNRLYRRGPDGRYVDATAASGLGDPGYGMGVAVGDIDNDGDPDVYVTNYGPDRLYRNRGNGTYEDVTAAAGIEVDGWSSSATFLDYDRDGWLDIYVARYVRYEPGKRCPDSAGRPNYCGPDAFAPEYDVLLHNEGGGRFTDRTAAAGIRAARGAGLGVAAADLDDDGWVDIYVANDGHANQLWINRRDGSFRDDALVMGAAVDMHGRAEAGMGLLVADLDDDGDLDVFMTHLANETNTWYRNRGAGRGFEDSSGGLGDSSLADTGFGTAAIDLELDGDLDVLVANGRVSRAEPKPGAPVGAPWDLFAEPNRLWINGGSGAFSLSPPEAGPFGQPVEVSRALAVGDLDDDGDLDLLLANVGSPARIYLNVAPRVGHWLRVRAVDPRYSRDAYGARLTLESAGRQAIRTVQPQSGYLTSNDPRVHFGLPAAAPARITVRWPDGLVEGFAVDGLDRDVTLVRGAGEAIR